MHSNISTTGKYRGRAPRGRGDSGGGMETPVSQGGRTIGDGGGNLKAWLRAATREKYPDTKTWDKVVSVVQESFREGNIPEVLMWTTMVLIPKGKGDYRGIGLLQTM